MRLKLPGRRVTNPTLMSLGKGKRGGKGGTVEKIKLPVETDTHKLVNYVCGSNIYITGEDVKLKPDSEYPEWLWKLEQRGALTLDELDPNTKAYWLLVRKLAKAHANKMRNIKRF